MNDIKEGEIKASLVICTYNRENLLVDSIKCALDQKFNGLEVIVVDQTTSHDAETSDYLNSIRDRIVYVFNDVPSLTKARNTAIRYAKGDVIIFVDDDVSFDTDFVSAHVAAHDKYDVVQGRVIEGDGQPGYKPQWVNNWVKFSGTNNCLVEGKTNVVTGCNFSIKKEVANKIGCFDEKFSRLALREDTDYGLRCYKGGISMGFSPEAKLIHLNSSVGGVDTGIDNMFFSGTYYENDMYFAKKHFSAMACFVYKLRLYRRGCKEIRKLIGKSIASSAESVDGFR